MKEADEVVLERTWLCLRKTDGLFRAQSSDFGRAVMYRVRLKLQRKQYAKDVVVGCRCMSMRVVLYVPQDEEGRCVW